MQPPRENVDHDGEDKNSEVNPPSRHSLSLRVPIPHRLPPLEKLVMII